MLDLRTCSADAVTSGAHLFLLLFAFWANDRRAWVVSLALISAISFFAWLSANRRRLAIGDTPTAKVASAPQGYVELSGVCRIPPGCRPVGLRAEELALGVGHAWYRCRIDRRGANGKWRTVDEVRSDQGFMLDDGTGECFIDPNGAEVSSAHKRVWHEDDRRYTEWYISPDDSLYTLGEFATVGGTNTVINTDADTKRLLAEWKLDRATLLRRFDRNGDGDIDIEEWDEVRREAKKEVEANNRELLLGEGAHIMRSPQDGRLYLISNRSAGSLAKRYLAWAWFHLVVFVAGVGGGFAVATGAMHV